MQEAKTHRCKVAGNMIMVNVRTCVEPRCSDLVWACGLSFRNGRVHDTHASDCINETMEQHMNIYFLYTSSTAQGGGGSFKNRKPIGEIGCCESGMAERIH